MSGKSPFMLDTNMVSYLINGRSPAARRAYLHTEVRATIGLSAITEAEIRFALEKKPEAIRLRATFEEFLVCVDVWAWDSATAKIYGKLRAQLSAAGKTLALMDQLIAAHAVAAGAVLVTHDAALQGLAPILNVVDWATDL